MPLALPLTRRRLLTAGIAVTAVAAGMRNGGQAAEPDGYRVLRARTGTAALRGADSPATPIWGYDGLVPGPTLRYRRGEEVRVRLVNELSEPTSVHWHGVRLANAMDGTALTQAPIPPGGSFDYRFTPPDAGTFWYHPHIRGSRQLGRGLSGLLIVDEVAPVALDRDVALVLSDWALDAAGAIDATDGLTFGRLTVNGQPALDIPVRSNERLRLRLVNASPARPFALRLDHHRAVVMAIDGEPAEPFTARDSRVVLGPGNRIDLFVDLTLAPGSSDTLLAEVPGGTAPLANLVYAAGSPARPSPLPDPGSLPANPLPERIDLRTALRLDFRLDGGDAAASTPAAKPLFSAKRGRSVTLALINRAATASVVHVHGHAMRLLDSLDDGWKPFWLDTILVPGQQTLRVAFVADNPGKWAIDGLNLGQPETGAPMWFEVV
jgi:FtsP/CotA-like multicopper oxidase with cupredoxin domain